MRAVRQLAVVLLLMTALPVVRAGEVIDRIVATVGKNAILESDLDEAVRFEAMGANRNLQTVTAADVRTALDRLVDQQLIRSEVGTPDAFAPSGEDVQKQISELRSQVTGAASDEGWRLLLGQYGLSEEAVRNRVLVQLETMRMVNQALRPSVRVDAAEIETYYRNEFLPKLRTTGAQEVPLATVNGRIRQILVERRIGELLDSWLQNLRAQNDIRIQLNEENAAGEQESVSTPGGAQGEGFAPVK